MADECNTHKRNRARINSDAFLNLPSLAGSSKEVRALTRTPSILGGDKLEISEEAEDLQSYVSRLGAGVMWPQTGLW